MRTAAAETGASVEVATETTAYDDAGPETVALVLAPTESYSATDRERVRAFVQRGGTVVVAEDIGDGGNRLLAALGAEMRFDGRLVADQRHHGPTVDMPIATNVSESLVTENVDGVMLNRGTVLTNTSNASVLVRTSEFAYLDRDGDDEIDDNETLQTSPVVGVEPVGEGTGVAVSDPSVFINAMQSRASNAAFFAGLVGDADRVLLDYSHTGSQPPVRAALLWLRRTPAVLALLGLVGVALVTRVMRTGLPTPSWGTETERTAVDDRSLQAYVRAEHPEWDETRIERVVTLDELQQAQHVVDEVHVASVVKDFLIDLVAATRTSEAVAHGASTRATLMLLRGAKARAAIHDREYVIPDDVLALTEPALEHRLVLDTEADLSGRTADQVLADVVASVDVPEVNLEEAVDAD